MKDSGTAPALEHNLRTYSLPNSPQAAPYPDRTSSKAPALDVDTLLAQENWVRAVARHLVRDPARAEDVAQETMLAALQSPPRDAEDPRRLRAWLGRVAHNLAHLDTRRRIRRQAREERVAQPESLRSAADGVMHNSILQEVEVAVSELEEPYQSAVRARYFDGQSTQEIACATFTTDNAVRKRLWRAREKLRQILDRRHNGERLAWFNSLSPVVGLSASLVRQTAGASAPKFLGSSPSTQVGLGLGWKSAVAVPLLAAGAVGLALLSNGQPSSIKGQPETQIALIGKRVPVAMPSAEHAQDQSTQGAEQAAVLSSADSRGTSRRSQSQATGEAEAESQAERQIAPASKTVSGSVLHVLDGQALAGVQIGWHGERGERGERGEHGENAEGKAEDVVLGTSDEDGLFRVSLPPDAEVSDLIILSDSLTTLRQGSLPAQQTPEGDRASLASKVFVVADAVTVRGRVLDPNGVPVAGAEVALSLDEHYFMHLAIALDTTQAIQRSTLTDDEGRFSLEGLPGGGGAVLRISPGPADSDNALELEVAQVPIPTQGDAALLVSLVAAPPPAMILSGQVHLATREPAQDAVVSLGRFATRTDDRGSFELEVDSIDPRADLRVRQEGWVETSVEDFGRELAQYSPSNRRSGMRLTLVERARSLEGYLNAQAIGFDWRLGSANDSELSLLDQRDTQSQPRGSNSPDIDGSFVDGSGDGGFHGRAGAAGSGAGPSSDGVADFPRADDPQPGPDGDDGGFDMTGFDRRGGGRWIQGVDPGNGRVFSVGPIVPGDPPAALEAIPIDPRPTFRGRLVDLSGRPLDGAHVRVSILLGFSPGPQVGPGTLPSGVPDDPAGSPNPIRWESPDTVLTDADGFFQVDHIPSRFCDLRIDHPEIGVLLVPVPDLETPSNLSLESSGEPHVFEVPRLLAFRIRVASDPAAVAFRLEDRDGQRLLLVGADSEFWTGHLLDGESPALRAPSSAAAAVLLDRKGEVLSRSEIKLQSGEPVTLLLL